MSNSPSSPATFGFRAQTSDQKLISGSIDASNAADAVQRLASMQLQSIELDPAPRALRGGQLGSDDFLAFNQQLAQLTNASLPVEAGLRMIANEMNRGEMKHTLEQVAVELQAGKTLPQAIEKHRNKFPPLYSRLIDAGVRAGNLPAILMNLNRHLALVQRMKAILWQTFTYPAMVLIVMVGVVFFILTRLYPQAVEMIREFHAELPALTLFIMNIGLFLSKTTVWATLGALVAAVVVLWMILRIAGQSRAVREIVLLPLPLIGPVLRRNMIARWCDAIAMAVDAGMDLPGSIDLASDAISSPAIKSDSEVLARAISGGQPISSVPRLRILPPSVLATMDMAAAKGDLPAAMHTLSQMYQEQAELRLGSVQGILMPIILCLLGVVVGFVVLAVLVPIISLIKAISGP
jgi:type II secretory pathway component PulF